MNDMNVAQSSNSKGADIGKPSQRQQGDTLSDLEDNEVEATMVEPDEDSDEDGIGGKESKDGGLSRRYQKALNEDGEPASEDHSFTRYLRASQM